MSSPIQVPGRRRHQSRTAAAAAPQAPASRWQVGKLALLGSLFYWAALPPWNLWPLAWLAPVPWLWLVRLETLPGRRPYPAIYLAGLAFWLATLHWLTLPHPATSIGWLALSGYLALYWPLFVGLSRVAVHRWKVSVLLAAPVVWVAVENARAHMFTGFSMAGLGDTQFRWIPLIQIADIAGVYLVSALVMAVAACIARALPCEGKKRSVWPLGIAAALVGSALGYGYLRLAQYAPRPGPTVSLIQGSINTQMKADPAELDRVFSEYYGLSQEAVRQRPDTNLLVWPETMYRHPILSYTDDVSPPPGEKWTVEQLKEGAAENRAAIQQLAIRLDAPLLLGIDAVHYSAGQLERYNSALHVARDGTIGQRYDKMHPVLFGEYVPFAKRWPWLYRLTPLGGGIEVGTDLPLWNVECRGGGTARVAANICYETVLPHTILRQFALARAKGEQLDLLVNLTNDGWFWGSTELDLHLICGVFRAVENRTPLVIAANTGFSASIDADGRILAQGPRQATGVIIADTNLDDRWSLYSHLGDWPATLCLIAAGILAASGWREWRRSRKQTAQGSLKP